MADEHTSSHNWEEAFELLGFAWNEDGTLSRATIIPTVDPTPDPAGSESPPPALSKDISVTPQIRLFIPLNPPADGKKLPLIIYFHGGDFCSFSSSTIVFHNFCNDMASQFPAVVASIDYRLAPENLLPAAYEDGLRVVLWARDQALLADGRDPWMEYADFNRVFLLGSGAGGNIAYHTALRALDTDVAPLEIKGLALNQPFFGGSKRTKSEIRLKDDPYVPLHANDVLWTLALPKNADRDHEFCNPISGSGAPSRVKGLQRVYVKSDQGDPLVDRSIELAKFLQSNGVTVYYRFNEGGYHGMELLDKAAAQQLYVDVKFFVNEEYADLSSEDL